MPTIMLPLVCLMLVLSTALACSDDDDDGTQAQNNAIDAGSDTTADEADTDRFDDTDADTSSDTTSNDTADVSPAHTQVITADWLNGTLSLFDYTPLTQGTGATPERTIDLSAYPPGPLQIEVVPNSNRAVVSISPGFFDGSLGALVGALEGDVPTGGSLLIVDLDTGTVQMELETAHVPMGIAISYDGRTAYTANYGTTGARGDTVSVIDLSGPGVVHEFVVGEGPEQVILSPDGTTGLVNLAGAGSVVAFPITAEPSPGTPISTGSDPSDLAFISPTRAVVANSQSFDAVLIDTATETALDTLSLPGSGFPYGVDRIPNTSRVLITRAAATATLIQLDAAGDNLTVVGDPIPLGGGNFPMNAAVSNDGAFAFVPHAVDGSLSVVDLGAGTATPIVWLDQPGPTYVVLD
ncbi:MAG: hypothetical protein AAFX99_19510 [Myxococcota bacterium]